MTDGAVIEMGVDWTPESGLCCGKPSANQGPCHNAPALTAPYIVLSANACIVFALCTTSAISISVNDKDDDFKARIINHLS